MSRETKAEERNRHRHSGRAVQKRAKMSVQQTRSRLRTSRPYYDVTSAKMEVNRHASYALSTGAYLTCGHRFDAHIATTEKQHDVRIPVSLLLKRDQNGRRSGVTGEVTKPASGSELT